MKMFDGHSHLGRTSSGELNNAQMLVDDLGRYGITKVGISSLSGTETHEQNDLVYQAMLDFPSIIYGYAFINPKHKNAINEVHRCLGERKMHGVKFQATKHGYYYENCPELEGVLSVIEGYGVHVQTHVGTSPLCTPYVWIEYAKRYPNLRIVFTHVGGREFGYSVIEAIKDIKNIWVETSAQMDRLILQKAAKELGAGRIIFGTDWPYKPTNVEIRKIQLLGFNQEELDLIYYKNIEQLWERV